MVSECGSPLPLCLGTGCEKTRRLVPHEVRESRAREDSRTPGRCRAHPRSRRGNEADPRRVESPQADGLRTVPECDSPLPLSVGTRCERTRRLVPQRVSRVESARGLAHSKTLPRSATIGWKAPEAVDFQVRPTLPTGSPQDRGSPPHSSADTQQRLLLAESARRVP